MVCDPRLHQPDPMTETSVASAVAFCVRSWKTHRERTRVKGAAKTVSRAYHHIMVFLLSKIMTDSTLRPFTIKTIEKVQEENSKLDFFQEFEYFLKDTQVIRDQLN